ncbi:MAG: TonB-dependent receptor [Bacteroidales bacterium]|nr:TonB-dependent receptor [Bacteroidales bacterium]
MTHIYNFITGLLVVVLTTLIAPCTALASEREASGEERDSMRVMLDEVTVTAIKQAPDISLQPAALTVVNDEEVRRLNIVTMKDVSEIAPNFYIPDYGTRMTSSIYVRGIGARIDQPVVGLNVDNVPFLNKDNYDFDLPDIERIEVLRGPQSTLYGRNTMGGQINIYTLSPLAWQGSRVMAETGSGPTMRMAISHYQMFNPRLGMAFVGYFNYCDGFFTNKYRGYKADGEKSGSLRWKTSWKPNSRLRLENTAAFTLSRQSGYPYEYIESGEINYNDTCYYRRNAFTDGLTVRWGGERFSLSSITSVQYIDDNMTLDQDFLPLEYFTLQQMRHEWAVTQDFVARSSNKGPYHWLGGLFGFYKHTKMEAPVVFKDHGITRLIEDKRNEANPDYPIRWDSRQFELGSDFTQPVWGLALYHQSDIDLGAWNFALGLRLDYEHASLKYSSHCDTGYTILNASDPDNVTVYRHDAVKIDDQGRLSKHFLQFLPKMTVSYRLPMTSASDVYVSVGKGYKAGGFNTQMISDVLQQRIMGLMGLGAAYDVDEIVGYKPEKSWNYEIGAHVTCADGRIATDLAAFWIDCRDQQLTMFPDGTTTGRITTNAGRTRSYGVEFQIHYAMSDRWQANASYGYTNATFREFFNGKTDYAGKRVPYAPSNTMFGSLSYNIPFCGWVERLTLNANVRGIGDIYWDEDNSTHQPFYALLGASATLQGPWWSLDVWGENLTDTRYHTFCFQSIGNTFLQRGKPARWGVTLRLEF